MKEILLAGFVGLLLGWFGRGRLGPLYSTNNTRRGKRAWRPVQRDLIEARRELAELGRRVDGDKKDEEL